MLEALTLRKHSEQNTNKLINNSNHCLFVFTKLGKLPSEIVFEYRTPFNNTCSHLIKSISQMRITLLGNSLLNLHRARLLDNRISASIFNKLFPGFKPAYVSYFSNKPCGKERRDSRNRRNDVNLVQKKFLNLRLKGGSYFIGVREEEEESIYVELKGDFKPFIRNTDRFRGEIDDIIRRERRLSTFRFNEAISYSFFTSLSNKRGRWERANDREKSIGKDIEMIFSFGEKDREDILDLSFTLSYFMFNSLNLPCKEPDGRQVNRSFFNQRRIRGSKESDKESISSVSFGRISRRIESDEVVNSLGIDDSHVKTLFGEEDEERDMEPTGGFHNDDRRFVRREEISKKRKTIIRVRERVFFDHLHGIGINDTDAERMFGDVNTYVEHGITSEEVFYRLSLTSILPNGWGFEAQSTYWELRDRGTDSLRGFRAYGGRSPCPSFRSGSFSSNIN